MLSFLIALSTISGFGRRLSFGLHGVLCAFLFAGVPGFAAVTTTTLSVSSGGSAVTTVASGSVVTLTATVNSGAGTVTTGLVNFCDATATYCTDIHILGTAQLTSAGTATLRFVPGVGSHSYKAVFVGTNTNGGSSSSASGLTVTGTYKSTTTLSKTGDQYIYTLPVMVGGAAATAPTGSVSYLDTSNGNQVVGTAQLTPQGFGFVGVPVVGSGGGQTAMVAGDFNGDGKLDIVFNSSYGASTITAELGNGDGTFAAVTSSPAVPVDGYLAAGDFNGDGKLDLAVASASHNAVTVLLGNGDGTFSAAPSSPAVPSDGLIAIGDFDGDGKLDIAVTSTASGVVTVLLGNGDGSFTIAASSPAVSSAYYLAVGDFNGDGKQDLAVTSATNNSTITILLGVGDGTFTVASTIASASYMSVADFNGDGKADLAVIGTANNVIVLLGNGDGTFTPSPSSIACNGPSWISVADFNGDGIADLAIHNSVSAAVAVLSGKGDGTFSPLSNAGISSKSGNMMATGDFNGDGVADIVSSSVYGADIYLGELSSATATVNSISPIYAGTHQIVASFPGDSNYSASISGTISFTVGSAPMLTFTVPDHTYGSAPFSIAATSNSPGTITYSLVSGPATLSGSTVTLAGVGRVVLQASQAASNGFTAATQGASFLVNPVLLTITAKDVVRVFGAANPSFTGTVAGAVNGDTFAETFTTTATPASIVGSYPIVPSVTGANIANYTVNANVGTLTVSQAGTATTFALSNQNLTLTATVAPLTNGVPTGTVGFYEGQTLVGTGTLSNGIASYTASSFPAVSVVVSAQYSGDANFTQSASPPIQVLSVTPASTSLTVAQAGSVTDTLNLSPAPGYTGTMQLSCSNLPQSAACSFQPSSIVFTGNNGSASATVTIQTGVSTQGALLPLLRGRSENRAGVLAIAMWVPGLFAAGIARRRRTTGSRMDKLLLLTLLCGMTASLTACGGSSTPSSGATGRTPAGAYTVQLVATGPNSLSQTTNLNLTVQ